jgi:hypothetical protein
MEREGLCLVQTSLSARKHWVWREKRLAIIPLKGRFTEVIGGLSEVI